MLTTDKMDSPLNRVPCGRAPSYCRQYMVKNEINISGVEVFLYKDTERPYNDQYNTMITKQFVFTSGRHACLGRFGCDVKIWITLIPYCPLNIFYVKEFIDAFFKTVVPFLATVARPCFYHFSILFLTYILF